MSEPGPMSGLTALERTRYENRRDFKMGLGSSIVVHACLLALGFSAAAAVYVATDTTPPVKEQQNQLITIETLVRDPATTAQAQHPDQRSSQVAVSQTSHAHPSTGQTSERTTLLIQQLSRSGSSDQGAPALAIGAAGSGPGAKHHKPKHSPSKPSGTPELATNAAAAAQAATNGTTISNQANGQNGNDDTLDDGGGFLTPGRGPAWSERAPSGPLGGSGGGHDDCTPSRGTFLLGYHRH